LCTLFERCTLLDAANEKQSSGLSFIMSEVIASYKLGKIDVSISKTNQADKLNVDCSDGSYHSAFTVRRFEYENYRHLMNQRIKGAFDEQYKNGG
jgi:hypothetical protein